MADTMLDHTQNPDWKRLSSQQRRAASLAALGLPDKVIARHMGIAPETVKTHLQGARAVYRLRNRHGLAVAILRPDLLEAARLAGA